MAKYELTEAELYFKKQLEEKGYKFIEKDGEWVLAFKGVVSWKKQLLNLTG